MNQQISKAHDPEFFRTIEFYHIEYLVKSRMRQ